MDTVKITLSLGGIAEEIQHRKYIIIIIIIKIIIKYLYSAYTFKF